MDEASALSSAMAGETGAEGVRLAEVVAGLTGVEAFDPPSEKAARYASLQHTISTMEGIICAGKSTLLRGIAASMREAGLSCSVLYETPDPALLRLFYGDMARYAFPLQIDMLRQRQAINEEARRLAGRAERGNSADGGMVWTDRSLWGDATFAAVNRQRGNISQAEFEAYQSILQSGGPYQYDYVVFLDVEPRRALDLCEKRSGAEAGPLLEYFEHLRWAYYLQLREQGRRGCARVVYINNDPFVSAEVVLDRLLRAPSVDRVREIFAAAPALGDGATPEQVSAAFGYLRRAYEALR